MSHKWLLAIDLDGTLFGIDHQVSLRSIEAIKAVIERGHSVVIVTGRSSHSAVERLTALPEKVRLVCSNGAYEFDRCLTRILWSRPIPKGAIEVIRQRVVNELPDASFGWESYAGLGFEPRFVEEAGGAHTLEQGGIYEDLSQSDVLKLYVRTPQLVQGELQSRLDAVVEEHAEVSTSGAPFVELTARGVDKGSALARIAADLGFSQQQTMAFGDNLNDVPMLRWAKHAVAMGNARSEVKDIAGTTTVNNSEDGVAVFLEQLLNSGEL